MELKLIANKAKSFFKINRYYIIIPSIFILALLFFKTCSSISSKNYEKSIAEEKNYYLTLTKDKDFDIYYKAQLYLNNCKYSGLMLYPNVKLMYEKDIEFRNAYDKYHNVYYFNKKHIKMFATKYCNSTDVVDVLTIIGDNPSPKFVKIKKGLQDIKLLNYKNLNNNAN